MEIIFLMWHAAHKHVAMVDYEIDSIRVVLDHQRYCMMKTKPAVPKTKCFAHPKSTYVIFGVDL